MFRRRPAVVRRGPGIVGTVARTAVVAGTATVTAKAVGGAMDSHAQAQQAQQEQQVSQQEQMQQLQTQQQQLQQQQEAQYAQMQQMPPQMPAQTAAYPTTASPDLTTQLQQLAQLKESGILSDEEFQAAKAKILG
jgi:Short C-terminal domain